MDTTRISNQDIAHSQIERRKLQLPIRQFFDRVRYMETAIADFKGAVLRGDIRRLAGL
jgi:hypothetical protein